MKINLKVQAEFDIDGSIRPTSYSPGGQSEGRRNGHAVHLSDLWQGR